MQLSKNGRIKIDTIMRFLGLATDYDGTIARHGTVEQSTCEALEEFKTSGRRLILVTGRELHDLFTAFERPELFDRIVAENGGVLYEPATKQLKVLAAAPPERFVQCLRERGVRSLSVGSVIVATQETYCGLIKDILRELDLDLQLVLNKGALMVLPRHVDKATGLLSALPELKLTPAEIVAVGDAENDHAFLHVCGLSVAVANALPAVKSHVHYVTQASHGAGVQELIATILAKELQAEGLPR